MYIFDPKLDEMKAVLYLKVKLQIYTHNSRILSFQVIIVPSVDGITSCRCHIPFFFLLLSVCVYI